MKKSKIRKKKDFKYLNCFSSKKYDCSFYSQNNLFLLKLESLNLIITKKLIV